VLLLLLGEPRACAGCAGCWLRCVAVRGGWEGDAASRRGGKVARCGGRMRAAASALVLVGSAASLRACAAAAGDASVWTGPLLGLRGWLVDELPAENGFDERVTVEARLPAGAGEDEVAAVLMVASALAEDTLARMVVEREQELEAVLGRGRRPCHRAGQQQQQQMVLLQAASVEEVVVEAQAQARADLLLQAAGVDEVLVEAQAQAQDEPAGGPAAVDDGEAYSFWLSVVKSLGEVQFRSAVAHAAPGLFFIVLGCVILGLWFYLPHVWAAAKSAAGYVRPGQGSAPAGKPGLAWWCWASRRAAEGEAAAKGDNEMPLLAGPVTVTV
jgi:hypothetical protein